MFHLAKKLICKDDLLVTCVQRGNPTQTRTHLRVRWTLLTQVIFNPWMHALLHISSIISKLGDSISNRLF